MLVDGNKLSTQLQNIAAAVENIRVNIQELPDQQAPLREAFDRLASQISAFQTAYRNDEHQAQAQTAQLEAANQALHAANEHLRVIFDSVKDYAMFTLDLDARITDWNTGAERVFGWTEAEAVGQSGEIIFTPEDREQQAPEDEIRRALEQGYAEDKRWHLRQDGSRFYASGMMRQLRDQEGVLRGFIKVTRDATIELERAQAQAALRRSREKYHTLFDSIDEGFCVIEVLFNDDQEPIDYCFLEVNAAFERQTGIQNAAGRKMRDIAPLHEAHWFEIYGRVALTGEPVRFENRAQQLYRYYEVYAFRVGEPEAHQVGILFNDISERRQVEAALLESEERFRAFVTASSDVVYRMSPDWREMRQLHGREFISGMDSPSTSWLEEYIVPEDQPDVLSVINEAIRTKTIFELEHRVRRVDGTLGWTLSRAVPLLNEDGEIVEWFGAASDITERKRAEEALAAEFNNMQILHQLSVRLVTEDDIQVFYDAIMAAAIILTHADAGTVQILDETTQELVLLASQGLDERMIAFFHRVNASSNTSCGIALATGTRTIVDFDVSPEADPDGSRRMHVEAGYLSGQSTPLITRSGRGIGMFSTHWHERHRPTDRELRFLDLLARQAADLLERQQAETALRESQQHLASIFAQAEVGLSEISLDGRFLRVNDHLCRMLGRSREQLLSIAVPDVTHPDDIAHSLEVLTRLIKTGETVTLDKRYLRADGTIVWANSSVSRLDDEHGQPYALLAVTVDLTERKRAEEQVRTLEQLRLFTVESTGVGDWASDLVTNKTYWSPRMFELVGVSHDQEPSFQLVVQHMHPDDRQAVVEARHAALSGANDGRYVGQFRVERASGATEWLEVRGQVLFAGSDRNQQPIRIIGTVIDITLQKQIEVNEREQRVLAEALRDTAAELSSTLKIPEVLQKAAVSACRLIECDAACVVLSDDGTITNFTSAGLNEKEHQALEQWHRQLPALDDVPLYQPSMQSGQVTFIGNRKNAKRLLPLRSIYALFIIPLVHDHGVSGCLVLINRHPNGFEQSDIAALQAFAYQIVAAMNNARLFLQAQELAAIQERQQLARDLHDAVTQTLFTASLMVESLPQMWRQGSTQVPQMLMDIYRTIKGAQAEMRSLLLELRPTNLQATPLTQLLRQLVDAAMGRKLTEVTLEFEGEPNLPSEVQIVVYRIAQEALNNTTKHANAQNVWLTGRGGAGFVELRVRDNGVGFALDSRKTGLGLQIMRERAAEINARLEIHSTPGGGTDIHLLWPQTTTPQL